MLGVISGVIRVISAPQFDFDKKKWRCTCARVILSTPNGASSGQFPEHQAQCVDVRPLEWLKAVEIDRLIQDFRGHVPARETVIKA